MSHYRAVLTPGGTALFLFWIALLVVRDNVAVSNAKRVHAIKSAHLERVAGLPEAVRLILTIDRTL